MARISKKLSDLLKIIDKAATDKKAYDIKILNVKKLTLVTEYFYICTADSSTQCKAIADNIIEKLEENNFIINAKEGYENSEWIVIDVKNVIIHIFTPNLREHYQLEKFWEEEIKNISEKAHDNLSDLIKPKKSATETKSNTKTSKKVVKTLTKKELIEKEILDKKPRKKTKILDKLSAKGNIKEAIEEEITKIKQQRDENRKKQIAKNKKKKTNKK